MRNTIRWALLIVVALIVGLSVPAFLVMRAERATTRLLAKPDTVLQACRELITNARSYRNDNTGWTAAYSKHDVILDPNVSPLEPNVPSVLRNAHPAYIVIHSNKVTICLSTMPRRYILAFPEGAQQYGTTKIIDGLWLSLGSSTHTIAPPDAVRRR